MKNKFAFMIILDGGPYPQFPAVCFANLERLGRQRRRAAVGPQRAVAGDFLCPRANASIHTGVARAEHGPARGNGNVFGSSTKDVPFAQTRAAGGRDGLLSPIPSLVNFSTRHPVRHVRILQLSDKRIRLTTAIFHTIPAYGLVNR